MTAESVFSGARREESEQQFSTQSLTTIAPLGAMGNGQRAKEISQARFLESQAARRRGRSPLWRGFIPIAISPQSLLAIASLLAGFALASALAVSPAPDGGYPGQNTAEGSDALLNLNGGTNNTATGFDALMSNTDGSSNTAMGWKALFHNTIAGFNTATGASALQSNTIGGGNTATGFDALFSNTTGDANTAAGANALFSNTTGFGNTATGLSALGDNTTGGGNTATGWQALQGNTTGIFNTATGSSALFRNTTGGGNTANGISALLSNTTGGGNTAMGVNALASNTTGGFNIALGQGAGKNLTTGNNNIDIGNLGVAGESNTIRIGWGGVQKATFIAGIRGAIVPGGVGVVVGINGQLGTVVSLARFKEAIKPMDQASEAILALKPVIFRYRRELDPEGIPQFGLVAEQVEKVTPDLVVRDDQGKVSTVRYEAVNAMLLNEFLKEHRKVEELKAALAQQQKDFTQQQKDFAQQQKEIKALAASLKEQALQIETLGEGSR
jgi:Chaperone of endosialidase